MMDHINPIRFTQRKDALEVSHELYRDCLNKIKAQRELKFENFDDRITTPSFMHFEEDRKLPTAVATFPRSGNARYFIFLSKMPEELKKLISKLTQESSDAVGRRTLPILPKKDPGFRARHSEPSKRQGRPNKLGRYQGVSRYLFGKESD